MLPILLPRIAQLTALGLRRSTIQPSRQSAISHLKRQFSSTSRQPAPQRSLRTSSQSAFFSSSSTLWEMRRTPSINTAFSRSYHHINFSNNSYHAIKSLIWTVIGLNTAVFGTWAYAESTKDPKLTKMLFDNFTLTLSHMYAGRYHTLLTCAFSHQDLGHFVFNMIGLYVFGSQILAIVPGITSTHVMALIVGSALVSSAAMLYYQMSRNNQGPRSRAFGKNGIWGKSVSTSVSLGASGIVMGLSAAATCLMPFAPMGLPFIPVSLPLFIWTSGYVAYDLYYLDSGNTRVGHAAHLGGFAFGTLFYFAFLRRFGGVAQMLSRRY